MTRRGFTLVEVLLSVAILGVVAATVALVLSVGTETWRAAAEMAEETHDGDAVMEQLVMALRSAYYPTSAEKSYDYGFQHEDGGEEEKAQDSIIWTKIGSTLIGEDVPWAGSAHRVRLFCSDDEEGQGPGLYAQAWQLVGEPEDFDPEEDALPVLLSDRVVALDCRMQDPETELEPGDSYEWIDEWPESNRIPASVRVALALKPRKKGADPDVLVRLVEIPMSAASWDSTAPDSDAAGRVRNGDVGVRVKPGPSDTPAEPGSPARSGTPAKSGTPARSGTPANAGNTNRPLPPET